jgi:hypothetical protein
MLLVVVVDEASLDDDPVQAPTLATRGCYTLINLMQGSVSFVSCMRLTLYKSSQMVFWSLIVALSRVCIGGCLVVCRPRSVDVGCKQVVFRPLYVDELSFGKARYREGG